MSVTYPQNPQPLLRAYQGTNLKNNIIILITEGAVVAAVQAVGNRPSESAVAGLWVNMWAATYIAAVHVFIHGPASIIHNCTAD